MGRFFATFFLTIYFLSTVSSVFAIDPPNKTNPADGSTVTSTTVSWEIPSYTLYNGDHYRIQIDDDQTFTSVNKDYTTENNSYTPTGLSETTWYWKIKAKDSTGVWSGWSNIWSFVLTSPTPTPTPSPTSTPTETPTPTSSPTSTQTPAPTKTPTPTKAPTSTSVPSKKPISISKPSPMSTEKSSVNLPASILGTNSATISPDTSSLTKEDNQTKESLLKKISTIGGILILLLSVALIATFIVRNRSLKV